EGHRVVRGDRRRAGGAEAALDRRKCHVAARGRRADPVFEGVHDTARAVVADDHALVLADRVVASAQAIRLTAVSGWDPNSSATASAHPLVPCRCRAAGMGTRTWCGVGSWDGCRYELNSASARIAAS